MRQLTSNLRLQASFYGKPYRSSIYFANSF